MERPFTYADEREWPTAKLEAHYTALAETEQMPYLSEERKNTIRRRMSNVAFEGLMRQAEANQKQQEIEYLENKYSTSSTPTTKKRRG